MEEEKNVEAAMAYKRRKHSEVMQLFQELHLEDKEDYRQWMSQQGPILLNIEPCATIYNQKRTWLWNSVSSSYAVVFLHTFHVWDPTKMACPIISQ